MTPAAPAWPATRWQRRARPLLGTLVEVGVGTECGLEQTAISAAFEAVLEVQRCLSRFDADSDISRFHKLRCGERLTLRPATRAVLVAARELQSISGGAFDISLGTAPDGWRVDGDQLRRLEPDARLDLGGIGKGYAVDCAVQALIGHGCAAGWVNAGGDLRAFGDVELPLQLRDEARGGVRPFATLRDGAFATSHAAQWGMAPARGPPALHAHVSVAAPLCLWADALTKVVALSADPAHPALARWGATAWLHGSGCPHRPA